MKKRTMMAALAAMVMAAITFTACGKEDDKKGNGDTNPYPKTLTPQGYEVKEFKMYVGSSEGGILVEMQDTSPEKYWKKVLEIRGSLTNRYTFLNNSEMNFVGDETVIYGYKFESDIF